MNQPPLVGVLALLTHALHSRRPGTAAAVQVFGIRSGPPDVRLLAGFENA